MLTSLILTVCFTTSLAGDAQEGFRITGVIRDMQGEALPGAKVTLDDGRAVVTDDAGRFGLTRVTPGTYEIRAALAGFRTQTQQVHVGSSPISHVEFVLPLGMFGEILHVAPAPQEAYHSADVIAHVRIVRQLPPLPCSELRVVSAMHEAVVLSTLKGSPLPGLQFLQESAGTCVEGAASARGTGERTYRAGAEYILFLVQKGVRFNRIAGGAFAFVVHDRKVLTHGFRGLPEVVSLDAFRLAVQELAH